MSLFPNEGSSSNIPVQEIESWKSFADSLKEEDRELFNKMLNDCYKYSNAINAKELFPAESLLMAIILQQHKLINRILSVIKTEFNIK